MISMSPASLILPHAVQALVSDLCAPFSPTTLQQVVCLSVEGLRRSFGVAMAVHASWWVEFSGDGGKPQMAAATTTFTFSDRHILAISPIHEVISQLLAS